ncbi:MAG: nicotinate-nucleotide adenylyltransferase [Planctomycetaceae bacterium]|nr:nicotinate-nucleotide adenylyltransferase [Planctomycetaceae bacterium]
MRRGIFGGTFDPVHYGHLILAETCRDTCLLDEVIWLPTFQSPFKSGSQPTDARHRLAMIDLAIAGVAEFRIDPREINRKQVSYTVETLTEMKAEFPEDELFFLIGADSLRDLPSWKEPERIVSLATIVAVNRQAGQLGRIQSDFEALPESIRERVQIVNMPEIGISATDLRERVEAKSSIRFLTPRPVERYIAENNLYRESQ